MTFSFFYPAYCPVDIHPYLFLQFLPFCFIFTHQHFQKVSFHCSKCFIEVAFDYIFTIFILYEMLLFVCFHDFQGNDIIHPHVCIQILKDKFRLVATEFFHLHSIFQLIVGCLDVPSQPVQIFQLFFCCHFLWKISN